MYRNTSRLGLHWRLADFEDRTTHEVMVDHRLINALDTLRANLGRPFTVTAGYVSARTLPTFECQHGSVHFLGEAADLVIADAYTHQLTARAMEIAELSVFVEATHLHVEVAQFKITRD